MASVIASFSAASVLLSTILILFDCQVNDEKSPKGAKNVLFEFLHRASFQETSRRELQTLHCFQGPDFDISVLLIQFLYINVLSLLPKLKYEGWFFKGLKQDWMHQH